MAAARVEPSSTEMLSSSVSDPLFSTPAFALIPSVCWMWFSRLFTPIPITFMAYRFGLVGSDRRLLAACVVERVRVEPKPPPPPTTYCHGTIFVHTRLVRVRRLILANFHRLYFINVDFSSSHHQARAFTAQYDSGRMSIDDDNNDSMTSGDEEAGDMDGGAIGETSSAPSAAATLQPRLCKPLLGVWVSSSGQQQ